MKFTFEFLILISLSTLLVFMVSNTGCKEVKLGNINQKDYVQYVTSQPILSMPSAEIQFDGDVYFAERDASWDWNDRHQQLDRKPALYLADPFINIQHDGHFQPML